jgi:nucleotidyltransferase AbiEii toxin of type IV toxin-antitoxin system
MPEPHFKRPAHNEVLAVLNELDRSFLARVKCYFGGGTRIVLELGEYRESRDIHFLCADKDGYRLLRESIRETSLEPIARKTVKLAREVRCDQYGIRTFVARHAVNLKFEIIREARIALSGASVATLPVACLDRKHCFAEKFLANVDRGLDASTLSRDVVDLAFMIEGWDGADAQAGLSVAKEAYGASVERLLDAVTRKMHDDRAYRRKCIEGLAVSDSKTLSAGLKSLGRIA